MKNIHVLPTDKPSRLQLFEGINEFKFELCSKDSFFNKGAHIYITSDEIVTKYSTGLYFIDVYTGRNDVFSPMKIDKDSIHAAPFHSYMNNGNMCKKIILTTDPDLIKDGVQAIDDEFLEWFVKNPSCEEVEIENERIVIDDVNYDFDVVDYKYKIIIPKEEPKQETLEEVANKNNGYLLYAKDTKAPIFNEGFIAGYQLAQQQNKNLYSEEEVLHILTKFSKFGDVINEEKYLNQWFNQFKKQ